MHTHIYQYTSIHIYIQIYTQGDACGSMVDFVNRHGNPSFNPG